MITDRRSLVASAIVFVASASWAVAAEGTELYAPKTGEQVRQELLRWLPRHGVTNDKTLSGILELWAPAAAVSLGLVTCLDFLMPTTPAKPVKAAGRLKKVKK